MTPPRDFYVYLHRMATTGTVFYVGKGTGQRAWDTGTRGAEWASIVHRHGLTVEIACDGLQEWAAHELERDLIALHGRADQGAGPLVNKTDGGAGTVGYLHSDELRARRAATKARTRALRPQADIQLTIKLPRDLRDRFAALCTRRDLTASQVIRRFMTEALASDKPRAMP